jgi:hypothetical protein
MQKANAEMMEKLEVHRSRVIGYNQLIEGASDAIDSVSLLRFLMKNSKDFINFLHYFTLGFETNSI